MLGVSKRQSRTLEHPGFFMIAMVPPFSPCIPSVQDQLTQLRALLQVAWSFFLLSTAAPLGGSSSFKRSAIRHQGRVPREEIAQLRVTVPFEQKQSFSVNQYVMHTPPFWNILINNNFFWLLSLGLSFLYQFPPWGKSRDEDTHMLHSTNIMTLAKLFGLPGAAKTCLAEFHGGVPILPFPLIDFQIQQPMMVPWLAFQSSFP